MRFTQVIAVAAATVAAATNTLASVQKITFPNGATVTGTLETGASGHQIQVFRGIPYAETPKRFKQSKLKPVTGNIDATAFGATCYGDTDPAYGSPSRVSEDCLTINVFTPANVTRKSKLPVMVWIYGGAFVAGMSELYPGTNLVDASNNQIVYVSLNYRTGMFGFFSNEELLAEGAGANFGLRDQEVAFEWVKRNIAQFGGNPNDITAFGESAGSMSVAMHMISREGNQKMFKRGIMESGSWVSGHDLSSVAQQRNTTTTVAERVGCPVSGPNMLSCLRSVDADKLNAVAGPVFWHPTVDGVFMFDQPIRRVEAGKISRVPAIVGTNTDEGWLFAPQVTTQEAFAPFARNTYLFLTDSEYEELERLYPAANFETPRHRAAQVFGDITFVCPSELFVQSLSKVNGNRVYSYRFNHTAMSDGYPVVLHGSDIKYMLNHNVTNLPYMTDDEASKDVVATFQRYWINFGTSGNPNTARSEVISLELKDRSKTLPVWPKYDSARKQRIVLQSDVTMETIGAYMPLHSERCAFWYNTEHRVRDQFLPKA